MSAVWKDIGPAEITYNGVVLGETVANPEGGTHGGCRFRLMQEHRQSFRDKKGTNPYDEIIVGTKAEIMSNLTGMSIDQLAQAVPGSTLTDGPTSKRLDIKSGVGYSLRDNAAAIILKPLINGVATADQTQWIQASLAHPKPDFDVPFDMEGQRVYPVTFAIFDNLTTGVLASIGVQTT